MLFSSSNNSNIENENPEYTTLVQCIFGLPDLPSVLSVVLSMAAPHTTSSSATIATTSNSNRRERWAMAGIVSHSTSKLRKLEIPAQPMHGKGLSHREETDHQLDQ